MDAILVEHMRDYMSSKGTEELLSIWVENDRTKYVEEAFEAIRQIFDERRVRIPHQLPTRKTQPIRRRQDMEMKRGGFFSFRTMISPTVIKIIYVLGMLGLTIGGIVMIKVGLDVGLSAGELNIFGRQIAYNKQVLMGIVLIVLGNFLWRLFCEAWILLFGISSILGSIERHLKRATGAP
ncbi:MAG: DUF4282 domain-containing protein [Candidatus Hodarchaeota archaeon]